MITFMQIEVLQTIGSVATITATTTSSIITSTAITIAYLTNVLLKKTGNLLK